MLFSEDAGVKPYPSITGFHGKTKVVPSPQPQQMNTKICATCGLPEDANPAHSDAYAGAGKHGFKAATSADAAKAVTEDAIVYFGGPIKSLGNGKIGGYAVVFSGDNDPDLDQDFFDANTDFWFEPGEAKSVTTIYDHGMDDALKSVKIGNGTLKHTDEGLWYEGQLKVSDNYRKYLASINQLIDDGRLHYSTGSSPHLIVRSKVGKSFHIDQWPIAELSLTPKPKEVRTKAVSLKSLSSPEFTLRDSMKSAIDPDGDGDDDTSAATDTDNSHFDKDGKKKPEMFDGEGKPVAKAVKAVDDPEHTFVPSEDDSTVCEECGETFDDGNHGENTKALVNNRPMKGIFEQELAEGGVQKYQLDNALNEVCRDISNAKMTEDISGATIDVSAKVAEAVTEYAARLIPVITSQVNDFVDDQEANSGSGVESCGPKSSFYLRSFPESNLQSFIRSTKAGLESKLTLTEHSAKAVTAVRELTEVCTEFDVSLKSFIDRVRKRAEFRDATKSGRVISASTLEKLQTAHEKMGTSIGSMQESHKHISDLMQLANPQKSGDIVDGIDPNRILVAIEMQRQNLANSGISL